MKELKRMDSLLLMKVIALALKITLKGGGESIIATSPNDIFTIPVVENKDEYDIDADHCISGRIVFRGIIDGEEAIVSYNIMLDLKPRIISYSEIIKTVNETNTAYSIDFMVRYVGSDFLRVGVREEYSPSLILKNPLLPMCIEVVLMLLIMHGFGFMFTISMAKMRLP